MPPQYTDHADQVIEKGTSLRLKILGVKPDVAAINAIGTIKEDYLGYVAFDPHFFSFNFFSGKMTDTHLSIIDHCKKFRREDTFITSNDYINTTASKRLKRFCCCFYHHTRGLRERSKCPEGVQSLLDQKTLSQCLQLVICSFSDEKTFSRPSTMKERCWSADTNSRWCSLSGELK